MSITETVLEMHYHKALMDLFRSTLGLGLGGGVQFFKYSQRNECFVGFDQAYVRTDMSSEEFFQLLKDRALKANYRLAMKFLGYFLQFKVVKELKVRKKQTPRSVTNVPCYRVKLDTTRNPETGLAQHELLFNLSKNADAMVYYACPMLFDRTSLYEIDVDLDMLRLADLNSCPSQYVDNEHHYIFFNDKASEPVWLSAATDGKAITPKGMAELLSRRLLTIEPHESAESLLKLLTNIVRVGLGQPTQAPKDAETRSGLALVNESLTIIVITDTES